MIEENNNNFDSYKNHLEEKDNENKDNKKIYKKKIFNNINKANDGISDPITEFKIFFEKFELFQIMKSIIITKYFKEDINYKGIIRNKETCEENKINVSFLKRNIFENGKFKEININFSNIEKELNDLLEQFEKELDDYKDNEDSTEKKEKNLNIKSIIDLNISDKLTELNEFLKSLKQLYDRLLILKIKKLDKGDIEFIGILRDQTTNDIYKFNIIFIKTNSNVDEVDDGESWNVSFEKKDDLDSEQLKHW